MLKKFVEGWNTSIGTVVFTMYCNIALMLVIGAGYINDFHKSIFYALLLLSISAAAFLNLRVTLRKSRSKKKDA